MRRVYIIGIGPGNIGGMTHEAKDALLSCGLIVGYRAYVDLVAPLLPEAEVFSNGMRQETERCLYALRRASGGCTTGIVCSGDSAVYGMAGLVFQLAGTFPDVEIVPVPGVTAALSGGALLGSPLSCDFAVVSLSNLLTPQETIEARLRAAASGDLALALYNPMSRNRPSALSRACSVLLESLPAERPCGYVRNVGRSGQSAKVCTLLELRSAALDMFCTAFVGSSCTRRVMRGGHEYLVTERGYHLPD